MTGRAGLPPRPNAKARISKESNIYDLVERAAAQRGIPRIQLWQAIAKSLWDETLRVESHSITAVRLPISFLGRDRDPCGEITVSGSLSGPPDDRRAFRDWLAGFRASVDRDNDPSSGIARILRTIMVRETEFKRWLRKTNTQRGPKSGTTGYHIADRKAFSEISRLLKEGTATSVYAAALRLARDDKLEGGGTHEAKAKRVAALYRKERG